MVFRQLPPSLRWLFLSNLLWSMGSGLFFYTLPVYAARLGASPSQVGLLTALGYLAAAVCLLPSGWLADRFERRSVMLWGWALGTLSAPIYFLAPSWEWLIPGELLNWGSTFCIPAAQAYTLQADRSGRPAWTLSVVFAAFALGSVPTPWAGGLLAAAWGPRWVFAASTGLFALSTVALLPMARQWPAGARGPIGGGAAAGAGGVREALPGWAAAPAAVRRAALLVGSGELLLALTLALGQVYVADVTGAGYARIGWLGSLAAVGATVLGPLLGWLADRAAQGRALQAAGAGLVAYAALLLGAPGAAAAAFLLRGAMEGTRPLRAAAVASLAPPAQVGRALSLANIAWGVASTAGAYLGGWLYQAEPAWPLWVTVAGGTAYVLALGRLPQPQAAAGPGAAGPVRRQSPAGTGG